MKTLFSSSFSSCLLSLSILLTLPVSAFDSDRIIASVQSPDRLEKDLERDINRKPEQVLNFFDIRPGMTVLDIFSGGGYYTELLSYAVGSEGKVISHNNKAYIKYVAETLEKRYYNNRLPNVKRIEAEANDLSLPANSVDVAFLILAYHDIYYSPKKGSWPKIDRKVFLNNIYQSLKPGGILAIIDHHAEPDSPTTTGHDLHRISVNTVITQVKEAGFKLHERAYFLENDEDILTKHMYAPKLRGKTSRFVLKFLKPLDVVKQLVDERNIPW